MNKHMYATLFSYEWGLSKGTLEQVPMGISPTFILDRSNVKMWFVKIPFGPLAAIFSLITNPIGQHESRAKSMAT